MEVNNAAAGETTGVSWKAAGDGELLSDEFQVDPRSLTQTTVLIIDVAMMLQPLVYAHTSGYRCIGCELPTSATRDMEPFELRTPRAPR